MPKAQLRSSLIAASAAALCAVFACDDDPKGSAFSDVGGSTGSARGGNGSGKAGRGGRGSGGDSTSGGAAGAVDTAGTTSGGQSNSGGHAGDGIDGEGGSPMTQGGRGGEPPSDSGTPGAGWYCKLSPSGCVCVQEENLVGCCDPFDCCYTYDGGPRQARLQVQQSIGRRV